jgi:hypothetical protein
VNKLTHPDIHDRIAAVERRLDRRRTRLLEEARESTEAASHTATKLVPVAVAVGAGLLAFYLTRRRSTPRTFSASGAQYAAPPRRALRCAQVVGIIGSAIRIGTSPQVRALWQGYRRGREHRRR